MVIARWRLREATKIIFFLGGNLTLRWRLSSGHPSYVSCTFPVYVKCFKMFLQSKVVVINLLESLKTYLQEIREEFSEY